ncbi:MAG: c-type cytochrome, partial [Gemmataceae bacterium]|nr:c-type cytochrome [Gemmataceae bacterium]
ATEADDPAPMVEAFLIRKNGPEKLAAALDKEKISADNAKRVLRAMFLAGRNDPALAGVVSRIAGLDANPRPPTPKEIQEIAAQVQAKGDAARGEQVFRRADLGCIKCHAVGKVGGVIGPDLGPIGGSSPLDYIIAAVLDPNQAVKEEYLTKFIVTGSGTAVTGIVHARDKNQVVLKDATGKLISIPASDIEEEANGKSLMPEGVTRILTRNEMFDLLRFVAELGKPGPYHGADPGVVRRWKKLRALSPALKEGVPNRDVVRDALLAAPADAWEPAYAMVNGTLPLDELRKPGKAEVLYLQAEVHVLQAGAVEVHVESKAPAVLWIDEELFENKSKATVELAPGRHRISVRVAAGAGAGLHLELRKPAGSRANFQVVQND